MYLSKIYEDMLSGNSKKYDLNECLGQNPMRELQKRANNKLKGAYSLVNYDYKTI